MSRSEPKLWEKLPKVPVVWKHLDEFYSFMYERHMIWHRRFVKRLPPPWTKDPLLRDYKFTNVYRELDYGTLWYLSHVYPAPEVQRRPRLELVWRTLIYRLVNRVQTFEKIPIISYQDWPRLHRLWLDSLRKLHKTESVFTGAHLTLPVGAGNSGSSKVDKLGLVLKGAYKQFETLCLDLERAKDLQAAFHILRRIECVGPFISYEICCDLMYVKFLPFKENDWVNPGPGCKTGIRLIFPTTKTDEGCRGRIQELQRSQESRFRRLGLSFPYLHRGELLTLRSIEHSLCEYAKYWKAKHGVGKARILFKPRDWPNAQGQLPFRFPRA